MNGSVSRIAIVILINVALSACASSNSSVADVSPTTGGCPCLDREFSLPVGAPSTIQSEQLEVRVESVNQDSRCPVNVTCVWEGDALVTVALTRQSQAPARLQLHTSPRFATEGNYLNYRVRLTELTPSPREGVELDPASYTATLVVSR